MRKYTESDKGQVHEAYANMAAMWLKEDTPYRTQKGRERYYAGNLHRNKCKRSASYRILAALMHAWKHAPGHAGQAMSEPRQHDEVLHRPREDA